MRLWYIVRRGTYFGRRVWYVQTVEGDIVGQYKTGWEARRCCAELNRSEIVQEARR